MKKKNAKKQPSNKELDLLGTLWDKYGTIQLMDFLLFLERREAMEHGAKCHGVEGH